MSRVLLPLAALVSLGFAPAPFPKHDRTKEDLKKLQGEWVRSHVTIGGQVHQADWVVCTITVRGNRLQFPSPDDAWVIRLDASRKPKVFDYQGATKAVERIGFRGVYRLEGDTLTLCVRKGGSEKERATDFDASKADVWLQVFTRKKP